ncbi:transposase, partial [Marinoscillum furvescens]
MQSSKDTVQISRKEYEEFLYLKEELAQLKKLIFGKKNERFVPSDTAQSQLDFGLESNATEPEAEQQTISYTKEKKAKKKPIRMVLPAHLPREEEVLEPEDKQDNAEKLGEAIT